MPHKNRRRTGRRTTDAHLQRLKSPPVPSQWPRKDIPPHRSRSPCSNPD
jgi:hypothetical protein